MIEAEREGIALTTVKSREIRFHSGCMVKRRWNNDSLGLAVMSHLSWTNFGELYFIVCFLAQGKRIGCDTYYL